MKTVNYKKALLSIVLLMLIMGAFVGRANIVPLGLEIQGYVNTQTSFVDEFMNIEFIHKDIAVVTIGNDDPQLMNVEYHENLNVIFLRDGLNTIKLTLSTLGNILPMQTVNAKCTGEDNFNATLTTLN